MALASARKSIGKLTARQVWGSANAHKNFCSECNNVQVQVRAEQDARGAEKVGSHNKSFCCKWTCIGFDPTLTRVAVARPPARAHSLALTWPSPQRCDKAASMSCGRAPRTRSARDLCRHERDIKIVCMCQLCTCITTVQNWACLRHK